MVILEYISVYLFGAIGYGALETFWRGYTHWTMLLTGGACCCLTHLIATRMSEPVWKKVILSAVVITTVEFEVGCVVNLRLGWGVWDYSGMAFDLLGQICPLFSFYWLLLSVPLVLLARLTKKYVFVER